MNRADFIKRLAELLADVSPAERDAAIQYYNDYFDDAGSENEQSVIASLGSPEQLARTIKTGLAEGENAGEFTEKGFSGYEQRRNDEVMDLNHSQAAGNGGGAGQQSTGQNANNSWQQGSSGQNENNNWQQGGGANNNAGYQYENYRKTSQNQSKKPMSGGTIAVIVILCILASPILLGIGGGLLGIIIGIFGAVFGIVVGFGATAIALLVSGVCLFVYGIVTMFGMPLGGLALMGVGMICAAIGLCFLWITVIICGMLIPAAIKGIVKLFNSMFNRGGATA